MNATQAQAHKYYKSMYSDALILYHFPGYYIALGEDVGSVSDFLPISLTSEPDAVRFMDDVANLSMLSKNGFKIRVIQCHNNSGVEQFPDIAQITTDQEIDY